MKKKNVKQVEKKKNTWTNTQMRNPQLYLHKYQTRHNNYWFYGQKVHNSDKNLLDMVYILKHQIQKCFWLRNNPPISDFLFHIFHKHQMDKDKNFQCFLYPHFSLLRISKFYDSPFLFFILDENKFKQKKKSNHILCN